MLLLAAVLTLTAPEPELVDRSQAGRSNITTCCMPRDARGRIKRSAAARHQFARENACPTTQEFKLPCPGYRIDHTIPLKHCGPDTPANMQWLTIEEWKSKSRWE